MQGAFLGLAHRDEMDSVVHETWVRLLQALDKTEPPTVADFFRLAAHKFRQVLLDMAQGERRRGQREVLGLSGADSAGPAPSAAGATRHPGPLLPRAPLPGQLTPPREPAPALSEPEGAVSEMHYCRELPQAEIARVLELHPRKGSYLWIAATEKLGEGLDAAL